MASFGKWLKSLFSSKPKSKLPIIDVKKRFELLGRTGQGSMSKVWRARDRNLGRTVCLKILDKKKTAEFEARFTGLNRPSEGAICMELRHPHIVQTFEHGLTKEGDPYLVMELIDGLGMNFLVETRSPQLKGNRIEYLVQTAEAIGYLHSQGYLHRDICPRNIMVTREGVVKLIDLGVAIPNRPEFCRPGNRTGRPDYLAPEIIRRVTTDARVVIFFQQKTAYEIFTASKPWEKAASLQTLLSHMNSPGKDPQDLIRDMDDETRDFLLTAIER